MLVCKIRRDSGENLLCLSAMIKAGYHLLSWINGVWNTQFWGSKKSLDSFGKWKLDLGFTNPEEKNFDTLKEHRSKTTQNIPVLNVVAQELLTTRNSTLVSSNIGFHEKFQPSLKDSFFTGGSNHWDIARFFQCLLQTIFIHLMFKIRHFAWYQAKKIPS